MGGYMRDRGRRAAVQSPMSYAAQEPSIANGTSARDAPILTETTNHGMKTTSIITLTPLIVLVHSETQRWDP